MDGNFYFILSSRPNKFWSSVGRSVLIRMFFAGAADSVSEHFPPPPGVTPPPTFGSPRVVDDSAGQEANEKTRSLTSESRSAYEPLGTTMPGCRALIPSKGKPRSEGYSLESGLSN